jgi:WhiB family redox-sensing transcriptional regulator
MEWRERGACVDCDPDLFFPIGTGPYAAKQAARAKLVCGRCEVSDQCLQWALRHGTDGIWGGLDYLERREILEASRSDLTSR